MTARTLAALAGLLLLAGCTAGQAPGNPGPAATPPPPPPPPAACLLDTAALAAATGLTWVPDAVTATDARCVYDPAPASGGPDFVAVDIAAAGGGDPATELDGLAAVCAEGSRAPAGDGFVCRFPGGGVFAATVRDGRVVTVAASAVPAGTTAARLVLALSGELARLGG